MAKEKKKAKELNTKSATIVSLFSNPVMYNPAAKGRKNYSRITYQELRNLAQTNETIRICINHIKREVAKVPWVFRAIDSKEDGKLQKQIDNLTTLFRKPNERDSVRDIFSMAVEDICVVDFGVWEKVKNLKGEIKQLWAIDGSTIVCNFDEYGLFKNPAYYQYLQTGGTEPDAEFERDDLLIFRQNPKVESGREGYGYSPVESIAMTALTQIQAAIYNQQFFSDDTTPPGWWNLPKVPTETVEQFAQQLNGALAGRKWKSLVTNSEGATYQSMRPTNMEMQFAELNKWLTQMILSTFGLNPVDMGMTESVNRSNSEVQRELSRTQGIASILDTIAQEINRDLIGDLAENVDPKYADIEFAWTVEERLDPLSQAQVDQIRINAGIETADEIRMRDGLDPLPEPIIEDKPPVVEEKKVEEIAKPAEVVKKDDVQKSLQEEFWNILYKTR